jgi:hypothetical protein
VHESKNRNASQGPPLGRRFTQFLAAVTLGHT